MDITFQEIESIVRQVLGAVKTNTAPAATAYMATPAPLAARAAGLHVKSVIATGNDRPGICPGANKVSIKLVYEAATRRVVGAQAWGKKNAAARVGAIAVAVAAGMTVEELAKVDFVYSSASCSIWDPIQIACNAAK